MRRSLLALALMLPLVLAAGNANNSPVPKPVSAAAKDMLPSASLVAGVLYVFTFVSTLLFTISVFMYSNDIIATLGTFLMAVIVVALVIGSVALLEYLKNA